jgi:hypothetical protein
VEDDDVFNAGADRVPVARGRCELRGLRGHDRSIREGIRSVLGSASGFHGRLDGSAGVDDDLQNDLRLDLGHVGGEGGDDGRERLGLHHLSERSAFPKG